MRSAIGWALAAVLFLGGAAFVVITIAAAVQAWRAWRRPCSHTVTDAMTDREKFRTYLKHAAQCERRPMSGDEAAGFLELYDDEGDER